MGSSYIQTCSSKFFLDHPVDYTYRFFKNILFITDELKTYFFAFVSIL